MTKVYVYNQRWEFERKVDDPQLLADEWLLDVVEVERAMRTLKPIQHRYLIEETSLYNSIGRIVKSKEDEIIDELGDSLDKDDDNLIKLQADLHSYQAQNKQLRSNLSERDATLKTYEEGNRQLLKDNQVLQEQVQAQSDSIKEQSERIQNLEDDYSTVQRSAVKYKQALLNVKDILEGSEQVKSNDTEPGIPETIIEEGLTGQVKTSKASSHNQTHHKGSINWEQLLRAPNFPMRNDLKTKKIFHAQELSSKISTSTVTVTEADLDYIATTVFKGLGYTKEKPNAKLFNTTEAVLIIVAAYTKIEGKLTGLAKLEYTIKYLYDDWYSNIDDIKNLLGVK